MYIQIWESYFSSPIKTLLNLGGMNVLDVGCGPALWIMEMATFFPLSNFTGVDIVQLYPHDCMPKNLDFIQANILDGIPFENESFDFIHIKDCLPYFPGKLSKEQVFSELVRLLKPGGWLEIIEFEGKMYNAGPNSDFLYDKLITVYRNRGINYVQESVPQLFEENNLVEFRREDKIIKYCEFDFALQVFLDTFKTMKKTILEFTSIEPEKYEEMLSNSCRELLEYQTSFRNTRFYGQKPSKFETI
ncbi:5523_t:CDS:2 [Diversispora eburnea]|uniref:5523_t:CDS:1 n=1 Tax=Diversispora eburnea TaxID=1213867 RepID=A0A9N8ZL55_9GLOM|nr:5523_t:CDS:2 [Diversispora eburnea]